MRRKPRRKMRKYSSGRKTRPWLKSAVPALHIRTYLYPRHLALMEALEPYVLADLQERIERAKLLGLMEAARDYLPESVNRPDIFLYALEFTCRKLHLDIEQIVNEHIAKEQAKQLKEVLFGKGD